MKRIVAIRNYENLELMLRSEDSEKIYPGISRAQLLNLFREIYSHDQVRRGVLVFQLS